MLATCLVMFTSCSDDTSAYNLGNDDGVRLTARKAEQTISRADGGGYFAVGTKYRIWAYDENSAAVLNGDIATETESHYLQFDSDKQRKIREKRAIYGFTYNNADIFDEIADPTSFAIDYNPYLATEQEGSQIDPGFNDYCRGYLDFDASTYDSGVAHIVFSHILSQMQIAIIQQGIDDPGAETGEKARYDIKLKEAKIIGIKYKGTYDILADAMTLTADKRDRAFIIYKDGKDIPYQNDDDDETNLLVQTLFVPQQRDADDPVKIQLTITGSDAGKFANANNAYTTDGEDVTVTIDLCDQNKQTLSFLPNYLYKFVVVFQGDDANIVSITPYILPWLDGETDKSDENGGYQEQEVGIPSVFADVQWNDRYMGASRAGATSMEEFVNATGYFYQKDRTVPFFPALYDPSYDGYLIERGTGKVWTFEKFLKPDGTEMNDADLTTFKSQWKTDLTGYNIALGGVIVADADGNTYEIAMNMSTESTPKLIGYKQDGTKMDGVTVQSPVRIFTRAGGKWEPVYYSCYSGTNDDQQTTKTDYTEMWKLPKVMPITSYFLTPRQLLSLRQTGAFHRHRFWHDQFLTYSLSGTVTNKYDNDNDDDGPTDGYEEIYPNQYVCTVDEFNGSNFIRYAGAFSFYRDWYWEGNSQPAYTWQDVNKQPCPPGWRLPTKNEMFTILPSTPLAGNICMLDHMGIADGALGGDYAKQMPNLEAYVHLPWTQEDDLYPSVTKTDASKYQDWDFSHWDDIYFPSGDPYKGDEAQYVISRREWTAEEWSALSDDEQALFGNKVENYTAYHSKVDGMIDKCLTNQNTTDNGDGTYMDDVKWGVIYAIKKQGTSDAYRMRWRVERIPGSNTSQEAYQLVVEKYKASNTDKLYYKLTDINSQYFFLNYDWAVPESVLYFPITGIIGEYLMTEYTGGKFGCAIYNYGTETILLTSDYDSYNGKIFQSSYRIKIAGTNFSSQYIYPTMDQLAQGGQVRPVRTSR